MNGLEITLDFWIRFIKSSFSCMLFCIGISMIFNNSSSSSSILKNSESRFLTLFDLFQMYFYILIFNLALSLVRNL